MGMKLPGYRLEFCGRGERFQINPEGRTVLLVFLGFFSVYLLICENCMASPIICKAVVQISKIAAQWVADGQNANAYIGTYFPAKGIKDEVQHPLET